MPSLFHPLLPNFTMQLDRDPDMLDLEKALSSIGKEQDAETDNSEVHRDSFNSNTTTLHNFSTTNDASSLEVEAVIKPALHHELDLRQDVKHLEASPISDGLPDVKPLAWSRYAVIGVYRRLFSLVFLGNLAAFIWIMVEDRSLLTIINAAAANLLALGLARQPVVVNFLFKAFGLVPRSVPLRLRRLCAKIYCYGGVHSGAGIASLFWYVGFIVVLTQDYIVERQATNHSSRSFAISPALMALSYIILILLLAIIIAAYPKIRFMLHDYFELTHRFCGWTVVALFWPLLILASIVSARSQQKPLGHIIIRFPTFWMLILTTLAILHPWLLLLRIKFTAEEISTHAIRLHFHHTTINFGQVIQLAKHPLRDWHSFATFPNIPSQPGTNGSTSKSAGFSCLISKAGDWTGNIIASPPSHLWKRGIPIYGFGHAMRLFSRIVVVTTGSGIGPCLSFLSEPNRPAMRVVWQTRAPVRTYGRGIMNAVYQLDPEPEVLDTSVTGRVDMLLLVMRLYREFEAEAVCVISNPLATRKLVFECESRGVPAFGPIFDS